MRLQPPWASCTLSSQQRLAWSTTAAITATAHAKYADPWMLSEVNLIVYASWIIPARVCRFSTCPVLENQIPCACITRFSGPASLALGSRAVRSCLPGGRQLMIWLSAADVFKPKLLLRPNLIKPSKPGLIHCICMLPQVWRWKQQYMAQLDAEPLPEMQQLIQWLESHVPAADRDPSQTRISHGDYRYATPSTSLSKIMHVASA